MSTGTWTTSRPRPRGHGRSREMHQLLNTHLSLIPELRVVIIVCVQVQMPSGNECVEFRVYDKTVLSAILACTRLPEGYGGLDAENLASVRLANKFWKESLPKRLMWAMTEGPFDATSRGPQSEVLKSHY